MCHSLPSRQRLRTAMVLQQHYQRSQRSVSLATLPSLDAIHKHRDRLIWARQRQLPVAAQYSSEALQHCIRAVTHQLNEQFEQLRKPVRQAPSLAQLYAEIASLEDEFERVEIDLRNRQLAVTTERIVLEEIDLGPFEIRLQLNRLSETSPYTVTAVDSHESSSGHPHPHISGTSLCEGDGHQAIAAALGNGLIGEFFVLVRQILRTYNEASAYRKLDEWHGVDCAACDDTVSSEDVYCCDSCHCSLCSDCEYRCETCHSSTCYDCSQTCEGCDDRFCRTCTEPCADCRERFCENCLTAGRCTSCYESDEEPLDVPEEETFEHAAIEAETPEAAVFADRVGEAVVST